MSGPAVSDPDTFIQSDYLELTETHLLSAIHHYRPAAYRLRFSVRKNDETVKGFFQKKKDIRVLLFRKEALYVSFGISYLSMVPFELSPALYVLTALRPTREDMACKALTSAFGVERSKLQSKNGGGTCQ